MIPINLAVLQVASLVAVYLTINGTNTNKRLLNALVAAILNTATAFSAFSVDIIKVVSDGSSESVQTLAYSDVTLAILHIILTLICVVMVVRGTLAEIEDVTGGEKNNI